MFRRPTVQMEDMATLTAMRTALQHAERVVFLGFAYHRPNLQLLAPQSPMNGRSVYGTVKNISKPDQQVVRGEVANMLGLSTEYVSLLDKTCSELFDENWRSLTA